MRGVRSLIGSLFRTGRSQNLYPGAMENLTLPFLKFFRAQIIPNFANCFLRKSNKTLFIASKNTSDRNSTVFIMEATASMMKTVLPTPDVYAHLIGRQTGTPYK